MIDKILSYVSKWNMLKKEDKVIVGVSGGADSVCLLFVLMELQKEIEFTMCVVHVNHMLRVEDAEQDEAFVEKLCKENQLLFIAYHYDVELIAKKWKQSTEEVGRILRRQAFTNAKEQQNGTKIAMAHHKNDNAETLILNLTRGTGLRGLGGILPIRGDIIRPLLCVEREEIEQYLESRGVEYCIDKTNALDVYTRNKLRNNVLPYLKTEVNAQVIEHLNETMEQMRELQVFVAQQVDVYYTTCVVEEEQGVRIQASFFCNVPEALQGRLIQKCLEKVAGQEQNITAQHVAALKELINKQNGRRICLPYEMVASRIYEGIRIRKNAPQNTKSRMEPAMLQIPGVVERNGVKIKCRILEKEARAVIPQKTHTKWFDYDIIESGLVLRTRNEGDYLIIDKEGNQQKLKSYFVNNKIPREERDRIFLLAYKSHILWIVGYRMSSRYQVSEHTKRILEIQIDGGKKDVGNN